MAKVVDIERVRVDRRRVAPLLGPGPKVSHGQLDAMTDLFVAVAEAEQESTPDPDAVRAIWDFGVGCARLGRAPLWLHADLHPANVLTSDGNLCGVVDFGDPCGVIRPSTWRRRPLRWWITAPTLGRDENALVGSSTCPNCQRNRLGGSHGEAHLRNQYLAGRLH